MNNIKIVKAIPKNAIDIINIQKVSWMELYPNVSLGITKKDVERKVNEMSQPNEIKKMQKKIKEDSNVCIWIAKDRNKVVGYIGVSKSKVMNILGGLHLLPDYQKKGIGKKLMEKGLDWLGNETKISLHVVVYNTNAIGFYKSFGFVENGPISDYQVIFDNGNILPQIEMVKDS